MFTVITALIIGLGVSIPTAGLGGFFTASGFRGHFPLLLLGLISTIIVVRCVLVCSGTVVLKSALLLVRFIGILGLAASSGFGLGSGRFPRSGGYGLRGRRPLLLLVLRCGFVGFLSLFFPCPIVRPLCLLCLVLVDDNVLPLKLHRQGQYVIIYLHQSVSEQNGKKRRQVN